MLGRLPLSSGSNGPPLGKVVSQHCIMLICLLVVRTYSQSLSINESKKNPVPILNQMSAKDIKLYGRVNKVKIFNAGKFDQVSPNLSVFSDIDVKK